MKTTNKGNKGNKGGAIVRTLVLHTLSGNSTVNVQCAATTPADREALVSGIGAALQAEAKAGSLAVAAIWDTVKAGAAWYSATLGAGMSDKDALKTLSSWSGDGATPCILQRLGMEKNRTNYTGKAMRGMALGLATEAGESVKDYAKRAGGLSDRNGTGGTAGDTDSPKARLKAAERALAMLTDATTKAREGDWPAKAVKMLEDAARVASAAIDARKAASAASADA